MSQSDDRRLVLLEFPEPAPAVKGPEFAPRLQKFPFDSHVIGAFGLVVFYLCGLWFISDLKLTRERYSEISDILSERAANPGPGPASSTAPNLNPNPVAEE